jgi:hypothetical protein
MVQHLMPVMEQTMSGVVERQKAVPITALLAPNKVATRNLLFALIPLLQMEERVG